MRFSIFFRAVSLVLIKTFILQQMALAAPLGEIYPDVGARRAVPLHSVESNFDNPAPFFARTAPIEMTQFCLPFRDELGAPKFLLTHGSERKAGARLCGNFGVIATRRSEDGTALLPDRFIQMGRTMGERTEIRGEQAGGGLVFGRDTTGQTVLVGKKIVNKKRYNLTTALTAAISREVGRAYLAGVRPTGNTLKAIWHYRYGTAGTPALIETHWHEWIPARYANVWSHCDGRWTLEGKNINHRITHNGDFDGWHLFGNEIGNRELGLWLERVLHTPNATKGDSPKIAGMMDLLITQGMWDASVRLAYQLAIATSVGDSVPSEQQIQEWAKVFEEAFLDEKDIAILPRVVLQKSKDRLPTADKDVEKKKRKFVEAAVEAFFHNDLYQANKIFMSRAEGSFGLVAVSTLDEDRLAISSKGQPMSIGFNPREGYAVFASDPAAINALLVGQDSESYRIDLDQKEGEVARIGAHDIVVYSMKNQRHLTTIKLKKRWIEMKDNPYIRMSASSGGEDPIETDIHEISSLVQKIREDWRNSESFNSKTAKNFASIFVRKLRQRSPHSSKQAADIHSIDVLITGVESSLWLGENFAQDLSRIFPDLNIRALSSNKVLQDYKSLVVGKQTLVLVISQSGQTYASLQATNLLERLRHRDKVGWIFILTGEIDTLMGQVIGQRYSRGAWFTCRVFTNGSGRRISEHSPAAVAATKATLNELLIRVAGCVRDKSVMPAKPFGMILSKDDLAKIETMRDSFVDRQVSSITGTNHEGQRVASSDHENLVTQGHRWARHVTEPALTWIAGALYVGLSVQFGIPLFGNIFHTIFSFICSLPAEFSYLMRFLDAIFYIAWSSCIFILLLRYVQGRELLARTGRRMLVIGDVPYVHQLLEAYVSKLFSLSYGHASLDVHSADAQDDMTHRFSHRVVRGVLIFLGAPDGRLGAKQNQAEKAVFTSGKHATSVANLGASAEVAIVGHDPEIANRGFDIPIVLSSEEVPGSKRKEGSGHEMLLEDLRESMFTSFERLLAGYVFFWAMVKKVSSFPFLSYEHWKSQSRTRIATTPSPVLAPTIDTDGRAVSEESFDQKPPQMSLSDQLSIDGLFGGRTGARLALSERSESNGLADSVSFRGEPRNLTSGKGSLVAEAPRDDSAGIGARLATAEPSTDGLDPIFTKSKLIRIGRTVLALAVDTDDILLKIRNQRTGEVYTVFDDATTMEITIGRGGNNTIQIRDDLDISRVHLVISRHSKSGAWAIKDTNSTNGVDIFRNSKWVIGTPGESEALILAAILDTIDANDAKFFPGGEFVARLALRSLGEEELALLERFTAKVFETQRISIDGRTFTVLWDENELSSVKVTVVRPGSPQEEGDVLSLTINGKHVHTFNKNKALASWRQANLAERQAVDTLDDAFKFREQDKQTRQDFTKASQGKPVLEAHIPLDLNKLFDFTSITKETEQIVHMKLLLESMTWLHSTPGGRNLKFYVPGLVETSDHSSLLPRDVVAFWTHAARSNNSWIILNEAPTEGLIINLYTQDSDVIEGQTNVRLTQLGQGQLQVWSQVFVYPLEALQDMTQTQTVSYNTLQHFNSALTEPIDSMDQLQAAIQHGFSATQTMQTRLLTLSEFLTLAQLTRAFSDIGA